MSIMILGITFISFLSCFLGIYILFPNLEKIFIQEPNVRSSHDLPKPAGGGIPFVITISLLLFFMDNRLPLICLPLSIIGFLDDKFYINRSLRFIFQVFTSVLIIFEYQILNNYLSYSSLGLFALLLLITILFVTSIINFTNFMDGMDGLVTSCLIIIFTVGAIRIDPTLYVIVGALLGFLFWNWHPSKIFMGDGGSTFLGALLAGTLLKENGYEAFKILIVSFPLFLDAFLCVIRRFYFKEPIFSPHSLHLFQRLYQVGWKHSKITLHYCVSTFILGIIVITNNDFLLIPSLVVIISYGVFLDSYIAVPFKSAVQKSRK